MFKCKYVGCPFKIRSESIMKNHTVVEHGICYKNEYCEVMPPTARVDKKLKRGQTRCKQCSLVYNNRSRPITCRCGESLRKQQKSAMNAIRLEGSLFSVRKSKAGINIRIIVNCDETVSVCYATACLEARSHYSELSQFSCEHIAACT